MELELQMNNPKVRIRIGDTSVDAAVDRMAAAWERAEAGETHTEINLTYPTVEALAKALSSHRLAILCYVHQHPGAGVAELARASEQPITVVNQDVTDLLEIGLLHRVDGQLRVTASTIGVEISV